jgi:PHP family Zn ribbon phosphoesterase
MQYNFDWRIRKSSSTICTHCNSFTKPDEWSTEDRCINCGPKGDDESMDIDFKIIKGDN